MTLKIIYISKMTNWKSISVATSNVTNVFQLFISHTTHRWDGIMSARKENASKWDFSGKQFKVFQLLCSVLSHLYEVTWNYKMLLNMQSMLFSMVPFIFHICLRNMHVQPYVFHHLWTVHLATMVWYARNVSDLPYFGTYSQLYKLIRPFRPFFIILAHMAN